MPLAFASLQTLGSFSLLGNSDMVPNLGAVTYIQELSISAPVSSLASLANMEVYALSLIDTKLTTLPVMRIDQLGDLTVTGNSLLVDLGGLDVSDIDEMRFSNNAELQGLTALSGLTSVRMVLMIDNPSLVDIGVFDRITTADRIEITGNAALTSLATFNAMSEIEWLAIRQNSSLNELGFAELHTVATNLFIENNPGLCQSAIVDFVAAQVSVGGEINSVVDNGDNCG